jgi:hypothetical protein
MAFLAALSLAKSMMAGIPVFRTPKQLREALKGEGTFGPMFTQMAGIQPIQFTLDSAFDGGLSLESKVFSIYAEGHVRAGKRETHVRVTAVVDFRKAPSVQDLVNQVTAGGSPPAGAQSSTGSGGSSGTNPEDQVGIQGALVPSTAGRVVYYRVN